MGGQGTGSRVPDTYAVHYGADDNASGTAGVIELAGFFAGKKVDTWAYSHSTGKNKGNY